MNRKKNIDRKYRSILNIEKKTWFCSNVQVRMMNNIIQRESYHRTLNIITGRWKKVTKNFPKRDRQNEDIRDNVTTTIATTTNITDEKSFIYFHRCNLKKKIFVSDLFCFSARFFPSSSIFECQVLTTSFFRKTFFFVTTKL